MLATIPAPRLSVAADCESNDAMSVSGVIQTSPVACATITTLLSERNTSGFPGGSGTDCVTVEVAASTSSSLLLALSTRMTVVPRWRTSRFVPVVETTLLSR